MAFFFFRRKCVHLWLSLEHPVLSRTTGSLGDYRIEPIIAPPRSEKLAPRRKPLKGPATWQLSERRKGLLIFVTLADWPYSFRSSESSEPSFFFGPATTNPRSHVACKLFFQPPKSTLRFLLISNPEQSPCLDFGGNLRPSFRIEKTEMPSDIAGSSAAVGEITFFRIFSFKAGIYPLGVWVNNWPAGHLVAEMMAI